MSIHLVKVRVHGPPVCVVCGDVWRGVVCCVVRCGVWWVVEHSVV